MLHLETAQNCGTGEEKQRRDKGSLGTQESLCTQAPEDREGKQGKTSVLGQGKSRASSAQAS